MCDIENVVLATVLTHNGAQRDANEDAVVVGSDIFAGLSAPEPQVRSVPLTAGPPVLVAVADGLGGHAAGEVAAGHTVHRLAELAATLTSKAALITALRTISDEITSMGEQNPAQKDMGTTVVGLLLSPDETRWFNVGDSRAYALAGGYLAQLSEDDSPAAMFAELGESPETTSIVTQILGPAPGPVQPHTGIEPPAGSVYLLCSDGLSDLVSLEEIEKILTDRAGDDARVVKALWAAAMNNGGRDNITIVLVRTVSSSAGQ